MSAGAGKYKLRAGAAKYKCGAGASKYKLKPKARALADARGAALGAGKYKHPKKREEKTNAENAKAIFRY